MPVPAEVTTPIAPLEAPLGTIAVICDPESTVNDAATPLNETLLAPVNAEPVNVTFVPTGPEAGENELTVGAGVDAVGTETVKLDPLVPVPAEVTTPIAPLEAPLGTIAVICDPESTVNDAATPLNQTLLAPVNAEPVNVTFVPTGPEAGENELTVGAGSTP